MAAQDTTNPPTGEERFLPKEPLDFPREELDLPRPPLDLPLGHHEYQETKQAVPSETYTQQQQQEHHEKRHSYYEVKTLLAWHAPGRPFQQHSRQYYMSLLLIVLLLEVLAFLFSQYPLMALIASFGFVFFALSSVPPHDVLYRISNEGITVEDYSYIWEELYDFYFKRRGNIDVLHLRTRAFLPGEITITLGQITKDHIRSILLQYLPYREVVKPSLLEKWGDWLVKTFPLEKPQDAHR